MTVPEAWGWVGPYIVFHASVTRRIMCGVHTAPGTPARGNRRQLRTRIPATGYYQLSSGYDRRLSLIHDNRSCWLMSDGRCVGPLYWTIGSLGIVVLAVGVGGCGAGTGVY